MLFERVNHIFVISQQRYHHDFVLPAPNCRRAKETNIPSLGLVTISVHVLRSSKDCVDSMLKFRKMWARTSFSSRIAKR